MRLPSSLVLASLLIACACTKAAEAPPANANANANAPGVLNPTDAEGREMRKAADGTCYYVVAPPPQEQPPPPGAVPGRRPAPCAGVLLKSLPQACLDATITAGSSGTCTCVGLGDPPFVARVRCPD